MASRDDDDDGLLVRRAVCLKLILASMLLTASHPNADGPVVEGGYDYHCINAKGAAITTRHLHVFVAMGRSCFLVSEDYSFSHLTLRNEAMFRRPATDISVGATVSCEAISIYFWRSISYACLCRTRASPKGDNAATTTTTTFLLGRISSHLYMGLMFVAPLGQCSTQ